MPAKGRRDAALSIPKRARGAYRNLRALALAFERCNANVYSADVAWRAVKFVKAMRQGHAVSLDRARGAR